VGGKDAAELDVWMALQGVEVLEWLVPGAEVTVVSSMPAGHE